MLSRLFVLLPKNFDWKFLFLSFIHSIFE